MKSRGKKDWPQELLFCVLELFILLQAPSIRVLKLALADYHGVRLSDSQLRRILRMLGVYEWRPSARFDRIMIDLQIRKESTVANALTTPESAFDTALEKRNSHKSPENSRGRSRAGLRGEAADVFEVVTEPS